MAAFSMTKKRANKILRVLRKEFELPNWRGKQRDTFKTLIRTVISQNTASRNTARAFEKLSKKSEITPEALSKAKVAEIEDALKIAGLYRNKARTIKKLSQIILEDSEGSLDFIFKLPLEQAREKLLKLPGVGPKTADVVLLFNAKQPVLPVDTHINRVSKRLKFVSARANYEDVRMGLQMLFNHHDYYAVHVLIILHGRKYCKAKNPLCMQCPINEWCPSKQIKH